MTPLRLRSRQIVAVRSYVPAARFAGTANERTAAFDPLLSATRRSSGMRPRFSGAAPTMTSSWSVASIVKAAVSVDGAVTVEDDVDAARSVVADCARP